MKHKIGRLLLFFALLPLCMAAGCGTEKEEYTNTGDVEFTVVEEADVPKELLDAINRGDQIEIEIVDPAFAEVEQGTESSIEWIELGALETNAPLRDAWDNLLLITKTEDGKNGILFVNNKGEHVNNNTLHMVLHNREFQKFLETEDGRLDLAEGAFENYADIEADEEAKAKATEAA